MDIKDIVKVHALGSGVVYTGVVEGTWASDANLKRDSLGY